MDDVIRIAVPQRVPVLWRNAFEYNGRLGFFGRWLFSKLSRPARLESEQMRVVEIAEKNLVDAILRQAGAVEMVWEREVKYALVGPDVYHELRKIDSPMWFNCKARVGCGNRIEVRGIPVMFLPTARGITCIPKKLMNSRYGNDSGWVAQYPNRARE